MMKRLSHEDYKKIAVVIAAFVRGQNGKSFLLGDYDGEVISPIWAQSVCLIDKVAKVGSKVYLGGCEMTGKGEIKDDKAIMEIKFQSSEPQKIVVNLPPISHRVLQKLIKDVGEGKMFTLPTTITDVMSLPGLLELKHHTSVWESFRLSAIRRITIWSFNRLTINTGKSYKFFNEKAAIFTDGMREYVSHAFNELNKVVVVTNTMFDAIRLKPIIPHVTKLHSGKPFNVAYAVRYTLNFIGPIFKTDDGRIICFKGIEKRPVAEFL